MHKQDLDLNKYSMGNCLGCEQEAANNERDFETAKKNALEYSKKNNSAYILIYKEMQEWKFIEAAYAFSHGMYGREVVHYNDRVTA